MGRPNQEEASRLLSSPSGPSSVSDFHDDPLTPTATASESNDSPRLELSRPHHQPSTIVTADVDLPPLYSEVDEQQQIPAPQQPQVPVVGQPVVPPGLGNIDKSLFKRDTTSGDEYYIDSRLDDDPTLLEHAVRYWATLPPRKYIRVKGHHTETVYRSKDKTEHKTITDFDVRVEITPYLYRNPEQRVSMCTPRTVDNAENVRRGSCFKGKAPGTDNNSRRGEDTGRIELGDGLLAMAEDEAENRNNPDNKPTLSEWCHRYCASHSGLKTFSIKRRVTGMDTELLKEKLTTLVRSTNYRGTVIVDFPGSNEKVEVYNDVAMNRWRFTTWIRVLFYCTLLFLFAWPYLFFCTARFEVVVVDWPFSRYHREQDALEYVSVTEEQLFNLWGRAVHNAVLSKRVCTLDQRDLIDSEGRPQVQTGNQVVDGLVTAGVRAMNEVNRQLGWGGDSRG